MQLFEKDFRTFPTNIAEQSQWVACTTFTHLPNGVRAMPKIEYDKCEPFCPGCQNGFLSPDFGKMLNSNAEGPLSGLGASMISNSLKTSLFFGHRRLSFNRGFNDAVAGSLDA